MNSESIDPNNYLNFSQQLFLNINSFSTTSLFIGIMNVIPIETPIVMSGRVIKGFGRGGKLLGIPTANLPAENFEQELSRMEMGVYIGFAKLRNEICKTVISIGNNPHFANEKKTIEPHLLKDFESDFYGEELQISICGFIRYMEKYNGLDELIQAIKSDIKLGSEALDHEPFSKAKDILYSFLFLRMDLKST